MKVYLDNGATTKTDPNVVKAMIPYYIEKYGNASSTHLTGQEAKAALEKSRRIIAKSINAKTDEIIFTSSGTEANNLIIKGLALANPNKKHIITSKIEHDCVVNSCKFLEEQGYKITYLDVNKEGFIDLKKLEKEITKNTLLVSIIHGNNEIGTIQDIKTIGEICNKHNVLFHTDACQSYTKTEINVKKQNLTAVTLNAHKIHGPKGVGALYLKQGTKITPLLHGGGHEFNLRSSTENVPGVVGFATASKLTSTAHVKHMEKLRDKLIDTILNIKDVELNGPKTNRLCNNINLTFKNIEGEAIAGYLDAKNICSSTGSACSSHSLEPSHVLMAIGRTHAEANSSLRLTLSRFTTEEEIDYVLKILPKIVKKLRFISPFGG